MNDALIVAQLAAADGHDPVTLRALVEEASEMTNEKMAQLLSSFGQHVADILENDLENSFVYVEADAGFQEASIFKDVGDRVLYFPPDRAMFQAVAALWDAAENDKKWSVLQYDIREGRCDARFVFPDQMDEEETTHDRIERALRERFGDKPVIYPPLDDRFRELTADDLPKD